MITLLRSIWIWLASATLIFSWVPLLGIIRLLDRDPLRLRTARWYCRLGRALAVVNPWRVHLCGLQNLDPKQRFVIVSNHQSLADIPVAAHIPLDMKWMAKAELRSVPAVGWMLAMADNIFVDRADRRKAAQALLQCARYLRGGCSMIFFPEGTRSLDGEILPFNEGPFHLSIREQVSVLPVVIEGSRHVIPRDSWKFGGATISI